MKQLAVITGKIYKRRSCLKTLRTSFRMIG